MTALENTVTTDQYDEPDSIVEGRERKARHIRNRAIFGAVAGVTALATLATGILLAQRNGAPAYETGSGLTLTNAEQVLIDAEKAYAQFITSTSATVLDDPKPLCYLATTSREGALLPLIACGPARHQGQATGAYDVTDLGLSTSDDADGIVGTAGTRFVAHGDIPAGAYLSRPDGLQPVDPSLLDLRIEGDYPTIPDSVIGEGGVIEGADASPETYWESSGRTLTIYREGVLINGSGQSTTVVIDGTRYVPGPGQVITVVETAPGGVPGGDDGSEPAPGDGTSITVDREVVRVVDRTVTEPVKTVIVTDARSTVGVIVREGQDTLEVPDLSEWRIDGSEGAGVQHGMLPGWYRLRGGGATLSSSVRHAMAYDLTVYSYRVVTTESGDIALTLGVSNETWLSTGASVNADVVADIGGKSDHSADVLLADGKSVGAPDVEFFIDADGNQRVRNLTWTIPADTSVVEYRPAPSVTFTVIDVINGLPAEVRFDADTTQLGGIRIQATSGEFIPAAVEEEK